MSHDAKFTAVVLFGISVVLGAILGLLIHALGWPGFSTYPGAPWL